MNSTVDVVGREAKEDYVDSSAGREFLCEQLVARVIKGRRGTR